MQNNKKKTSISQFKKLCNSVFALSQNIRFAGVIDKMGKLAAGGMAGISVYGRQREFFKIVFRIPN